MHLEGKIAIITGAGSGLGLGTCAVLAAAGAKVAAFDVNAESLAKAHEAGGTDLMTREVDVADADAVKAGIDAVLERWRALHIAVNCAGVIRAVKTVSKGEPFPLAAWERVIAVNLTGTFNVIRLAAVAMSRTRRHRAGAIAA